MAHVKPAAMVDRIVVSQRHVPAHLVAFLQQMGRPVQPVHLAGVTSLRQTLAIVDRLLVLRPPILECALAISDTIECQTVLDVSSAHHLR